MNILIRKMNLDDSNEVFDMMKIFYASEVVINKPDDSVLHNNIKWCLDKDDLLTCFVVLVDEKIAGYTILSKCFSTEYGGVCMWVEDVYVKPEYRKLGLGKKIFEFIESEYSGHIVRYKLEVEENNVPAMRLYEKCGYKKSNYIVMVKEV